jgi:hypothetical protein
MRRRELLTPAQREELLAFPTEEVDLIRNYTFSAHDLAVIRRCRGDHNRLGFSVQLCYYAKVGQALIKAKEAGNDPFLAIEEILSWEQFTQSVSEAEKLARPEDFDYLGLLGDHYPQLRRYLPAFLEAFEFKAAPTARNIIEALEVLRKLFASKARSIPDDAPTEFIRRRWAPHVFTGSNLDRRYYELCAVTELKNALRSGDIWVPGSRQFKDFEDYLLPRTAFESMLASGAPPLRIDGSFDR